MTEPTMAANDPLILLVEDDDPTRRLLTCVLGRGGYRVSAVTDGNAGLQAVAEQAPDLVLLDLRLPGAGGLEVCRRIRANPRTATLPVILMTAATDANDLIAGLDAGADDFLTKPFDNGELLARIRSAFRLRSALVRLDTAHQVAAALANAIEEKDPETERHSQRLSDLATRLGIRIGLSGQDLEAVAYGALLHDVGKIGVPERVLLSTNELTEDEWELMRRHPETGERICRPIRAVPACLIVRHHHERWDGTGYPDGLKGAAIPLGARIVAIVDAFDAMTNVRPYRAAMPLEAALAELRSLAGRQFDPGLVPEMLEIVAADAGAPRVAIPLPTLAATMLAS